MKILLSCEPALVEKVCGSCLAAFSELSALSTLLEERVRERSSCGDSGTEGSGRKACVSGGEPEAICEVVLIFHDDAKQRKKDVERLETKAIIESTFLHT